MAPRPCHLDVVPATVVTRWCGVSVVRTDVYVYVCMCAFSTSLSKDLLIISSLVQLLSLYTPKAWYILIVVRRCG